MVSAEIQNIQAKQKERAKVTMLWIGIVGIVMLFAAFTSGYILSMGRKDWIPVDIPLPFIYSTFLILASSATMFWGQQSIKKGNVTGLRVGVLLTLLLGIGFTYTQYAGFNQLFNEGHTFVSRNPADSWMILIPFMHFLHIFGGIIALLVVARRARKGKYSAKNHLGVRLASIYWHFLDILWLYLFAFLYLIR